MSFNSPQFLAFLPVVLVLYALMFKRDHLRTILLLCASYSFYMAWNWKYAGLIAFSTVIDYFLGLRMAREENHASRRLLLIISLVMNLGLLALFKYYNFFVDTLQDSLTFFGAQVHLPHHELLLPVGISFYTFQTLSYTIDIYRRQLGPERNFFKFALFVAFFPQLVAGPIVRAADFLPQLQGKPDASESRLLAGMQRVFRGLFKKVVIADLLAGLAVDAVFENPAAFSSWDLLFALYGYTFQIYNDFSGYSDIAIGVAAMLGFHIPENFNRPYLSRSVREFWTRWHISLSSWLRDYLYISLGGNRSGKARVKFNLMLTMLLGGLWHGAALNFVAWGAYHGALLFFGRQKERAGSAASALRVFVERFVCFHLVVVGWLLFRVSGMENLTQYLNGLGQWTGGSELSKLFYCVLALGLATHFLPAKWGDGFGKRIERSPIPLQAAFYAGVILFLCGISMQAPAFIYFQF